MQVDARVAAAAVALRVEQRRTVHVHVGVEDQAVRHRLIAKVLRWGLHVLLVDRVYPHGRHVDTPLASPLVGLPPGSAAVQLLLNLATDDKPTGPLADGGDDARSGRDRARAASDMTLLAAHEGVPRRLVDLAGHRQARPCPLEREQAVHGAHTERTVDAARVVGATPRVLVELEPLLDLLLHARLGLVRHTHASAGGRRCRGSGRGLSPTQQTPGHLADDAIGSDALGRLEGLGSGDGLAVEEPVDHTGAEPVVVQGLLGLPGALAGAAVLHDHRRAHRGCLRRRGRGNRADDQAKAAHRTDDGQQESADPHSHARLLR